ncbi:uncharacterized protein [Palaemon carinicauda]|uniref:uncharacterized protein n=1 Tax=Palaemon carinicauda TaxID=392227 RepID=UPI0035B6106F
MQGTFEPSSSSLELVEQPQPWHKGPKYLRRGVEVSGVILSFPLIVYLGVAGAMFLLSGIIILLVTRYKDFMVKEYESNLGLSESGEVKDKGVDPSLVVGIICIIIGVWLIAGCIGLACYARKKYKELESINGDNTDSVLSGTLSPTPFEPATLTLEPVCSPPPVTRLNNLPPVRNHRRLRPMGATEDQIEYAPVAGEQYAIYPPISSLPYPGVNQRTGTAREKPPPGDRTTPEEQEPSPDLPGMALAPNNRDESEFASPPPYAPDYNPPI